MWNKFHKNKTTEVWSYFGIVLKSGDVLYTYARDEEEAITKVFGNRPSYATKHAICNVVPCKIASVGDLTFLGK